MNVIRIPVIIVLTILWALLWRSFSPMILVGGLIVSTLVALVFPFPKVELAPVVRPWPLIVLTSVFLWDMTRASFQVGWFAIRRKPCPQAALIEAPLVTGSDILQTITAEMICLVPGSLLIELDSEGKRMWLHVMNVDSDEALEGARKMARDQEYRVVAALGSAEEYEAVKRRRKEALT